MRDPGSLVVGILLSLFFGAMAANVAGGGVAHELLVGAAGFAAALFSLALGARAYDRVFATRGARDDSADARGGGPRQ